MLGVPTKQLLRETWQIIGTFAFAFGVMYLILSSNE